jgi:hypothetical protein
MTARPFGGAYLVFRGRVALVMSNAIGDTMVLMVGAPR